MYLHLLKFGCVFIMAILIRVFLFEIYTVTGSSMEGTLIEGDKILVCKLCYGVKLPNSLRDIPWLNLLSFSENISGSKKKLHVKNFQLHGLLRIQRNDVVVFKSPINETPVHIKRCIGLEGDTIQVKDGIVSINSNKIEIPNKIINRYHLWINNINKFMELIDKLNHQGLLSISDSKPIQGEIFIQQFEVETILYNSSIDSFKIIEEEIKLSDNTISTNDELNWTSLNYGPVWIPAKNTRLKLAPDNSNLYKEIIQKYDGIKSDYNKNQFYENRPFTDFYLFEQNYYFMMGDNRSRSYDSRNYGFIPEDLIIGKALFIIINYNKGKFSWNRVLKKIE